MSGTRRLRLLAKSGGSASSSIKRSLAAAEAGEASDQWVLDPLIII
jgi:hypothetical protein